MEIRSMSPGSWIAGAGKAGSPPGFEVRNHETEIKQETVTTSQQNVKEQKIDEPNAQSTKPDFHTKRPVRAKASDAAESHVSSTDEAHPSADVAPVAKQDSIVANPAALTAAAEFAASTVAVPSADIEFGFDLAPMSTPQNAAELAVRIEQFNRGPVKGPIPSLLSAFHSLSADIANLTADFAVPTFDSGLGTATSTPAQLVSPDGDISAMPASSAEIAHYPHETAAATTKLEAGQVPVPAFDEAPADYAGMQASLTQVPVLNADLVEHDGIAAVPNPVPSVDSYLDADLATSGLTLATVTKSADLADLQSDLNGQNVGLPIDPDLQSVDPVTLSDLRHLAADISISSSDVAEPQMSFGTTGPKVSADIEANPKAAVTTISAPAADVGAPAEDGLVPTADIAEIKVVPQNTKAEAESAELETRSADFIEGTAAPESKDKQTGSWSKFDAPFIREQSSVKVAPSAAPDTPKLTDAQVKNVIGQVVDRAEALAASRPRNGVTIHLRPQELGTITLFVKRNGTSEVEAQMYASNEQVREALESNRGALLHNFEAKGISVASVTVTDSPISANTNSSADSRTLSHNANQARQPHGFAGETDGHAMDAETMRQRIRSSSGMDIWI